MEAMNRARIAVRPRKIGPNQRADRPASGGAQEEKTTQQVSGTTIRLLAFLLITTEIFILFSLVEGSLEGQQQAAEKPSLSSSSYDDYSYDNNNNNNKRQDNIAIGFNDGGDDNDPKQVIRVEGDDEQPSSPRIGHSNGIQEYGGSRSAEYLRSFEPLDDDDDDDDDDDGDNALMVARYDSSEDIAKESVAAEVDGESSSSRTNSLIESAPVDTQTSIQQREQLDYTGGQHAHNGHIRPPHELVVGKSRHSSTRHKNTWCHRDCIDINGHSNRRQHLAGNKRRTVCASDGRTYKSMCELRRHSCRHNVHLIKKPHTYCSQPPPIDRNSSGIKAQEQVRIVGLKRQCQRSELQEMKRKLMHEFNRDLIAMFKYFDSNGDNFIEAHELWPRRELDANRLLYAQLWDDHTSKCQSKQQADQSSSSSSSSLGLSGDGGQYERHKYSFVEDQLSKCWYFLDFAFEPKFVNNPCSLSHLMLFDLKHPSSKFTFDTFSQSFTSVDDVTTTTTTAAYQNETNNKTNPTEPIERLSQLHIGLGESVSLSCLPTNTTTNQYNAGDMLELGDDELGRSKCLWTRYNLNLAAIQDPHISIVQRQSTTTNSSDLILNLKDAQLYLSGQFKCVCHLKRHKRNFEHIYTVQVSAKPRVHVRPHFQWSLPSSRVSFECHYDYIDTSSSLDALQLDGINFPSGDSTVNYTENLAEFARGQFGLKVEWLKNNQEVLVDSKRFSGVSAELIRQQKQSQQIASQQTMRTGDDFDDYEHIIDNRTSMGLDNSIYTSPTSQSDEAKNVELRRQQPVVSESSLRASITLAASRFTLENLQFNDTGLYTCGLEVPRSGTQVDSSAPTRRLNLYAEDQGTLLVQEKPRGDQSDGSNIVSTGTSLWMFHDNGISVYKLQNDDGQEMELLREINGHMAVSGEVDGNWNQLTLCGGLNPEQVVICEWSDNALHIDVDLGEHTPSTAAEQRQPRRTAKKYIYVGQPNLNRIIVIDGSEFEIVAIINTEPQPRKLHLYKPNKIHLNKWVRRRLSPAANARWLSAVGTHAHALKSTPDSALYSSRPSRDQVGSGRVARESGNHDRSSSSSATNHQMPPKLIQHDIWLLCYGQPLVVDPSGDERLEELGSFYSAAKFGADTSSNSTTTNGHAKRSAPNISQAVHPFTPRLSPLVGGVGGGSSFGWRSVWPNKESKLRNRKSVHIIQSTFFPQQLLDGSLRGRHHHRQQEQSYDDVDADASAATPRRRRQNETVVGEFKRSSVLTTHHVIAGIPANRLMASQRYHRHLKRAAQFDLIQDLEVPPKPYSLEANSQHKIHYAYVTHYDERRLFRVSMDEYRYDREIDLQNCDPINLIATAQGLLVVQCRAPITHNPIGQLVLDQLTSSRVEFNANIRAQESYLSPDNRYLVSIYTNTSTAPPPPLHPSATPSTPSTTTARASSLLSNSDRATRKRSTTANWANPNDDGSPEDDSSRQRTRQSSIVYVQLVTLKGLRLQYEIKTSFEISQCSFVWKDGYYAAIFVSTNRRDQQSEILSLRLADSRLELMARVPGLVSLTRRKDQLIVSPELRLAALSTNQGTYVVDLEDNRVSQSLRYHQSSPTLLWV